MSDFAFHNSLKTDLPIEVKFFRGLVFYSDLILCRDLSKINTILIPVFWLECGNMAISS